MRRFQLAAAALLAAACAPTDSTDVMIPLYAVEAAHFRAAPLTGANEVPAVTSKAVGNATFHLSADGTEMSYRLNVANIAGVTQAHIHIGSATGTGPFVVFLFPLTTEGVTVRGTLATGTFTEADLVARSNIGFGGTMEELLAAMRSGNAYVNVHTVANPAGEIRAQIH